MSNKRSPTTILLVVVLLLAIIIPSFAQDVASGNITQGELRVEIEEKVLNLPLKHTWVDAKVTGYIARVTVTQHYTNPFDKPIEVVYCFPLPQNSAVDEMTMVIGNRVIKGEINRREQAREIYEEAKYEGKTASLLELERPNIFTQSVANIIPGDDIYIQISYVQTLTYDNGTYEFVFPMVVGPRFIPGAPTHTPSRYSHYNSGLSPSSKGDNTLRNKPTSLHRPHDDEDDIDNLEDSAPKYYPGDGWSADTDLVPDASRITPPVLKPGYRSGHDVSLTLEVETGIPI